MSAHNPILCKIHWANAGAFGTDCVARRKTEDAGFRYLFSFVERVIFNYDVSGAIINHRRRGEHSIESDFVCFKFA